MISNKVLQGEQTIISFQRFLRDTTAELEKVGATSE